ncbi:glycosyltransferase family 92 protein RCOM_0530710 [Fagus crenata]
MDSEQRRKRKRIGRSYHSYLCYLSFRSFVLCFSFFVFLVFVSSDRFPFGPESFRPVLKASSTLLISSSSKTSSSVLDSFNKLKFLPLRVEDRVLFPDHVLLIVSNKLHHSQDLECVYYNKNDESPSFINSTDVRPVLSTDKYGAFRSIVRCPVPEGNYSGVVDLRSRGGGDVGDNDWTDKNNQTVYWWEKVVYEAVLDGDTAVLFVKGLNLRPHKRSDPTRFSCHFGFGNWGKDEEGFVLTTEAVTAAQEVVRCLLPRSIRNSPERAQGIRVSLSHVRNGKGNARAQVQEPMASVAKIYGLRSEEEKKVERKYELCVCTMVWNQAPALREWIMYHAWLGVERWFIYDNNSDDGIEEMIKELENYNVSRQSWPWIKAQEAGFSHCALRARDECNWVGFFDVDEFFYFPYAFRHPKGRGLPGLNKLKSMVANLSSSTTIAEIRTTCHSFGPSGLSEPPVQGVTVGYTCRLQSPERHKSIVRPDMLDSSLLNVVHHFQLREGFRHLNVLESAAVMNHYKYQVWDTFKAKFFRRVATYVVDWQKDKNKGSKDRAPGLGTAAIEPPNWQLRFCEVWDTGLRDFVLAYLADPGTGLLPWERSLM